jgi:hypothetical protein
MTSKSIFDAAALNLPEPTPEDVAALARAEQHNTMTPEESMQFLLQMTANLPASRETNSDSDEPFTL